MGCSPPGSSVHSIFQARILEWVAISFSRGVFPTQGSKPGLLHSRQILYLVSYHGKPDGRHNGISVLKRRNTEVFFLPIMWEYKEETATYKPGTEPLPTSWPCSHFHLGLSASRTMRNKRLLLKALGVWYSVTAVQTKKASWKDLESEKFLNGKSAERTMRREGRNQILIKGTGSMLGVMDQITVLLREEPTFPSVSPFFICIYLGGFLW